MSTLNSEIIDVALQIGRDGFDSLKLNGVEELWADEPLTDVYVISLVNDNEKNVDSGEIDTEWIVVRFNSKQIGDILNKVNDLQNLILSMDTDT